MFAAVLAASFQPSVCWAARSISAASRGFNLHQRAGGAAEAVKSLDRSGSREWYCLPTCPTLLQKAARSCREGISRDRRWNGGFVENSTQTNTDGHAAGRTVRVPFGRLDQAMSEVKNVAISVERENIEARDVTREYMILRLACGMLRRKKHSTCRS